MACRIVKDNRARIKAEVRARLQTIVQDGAEAVAEAARANAPVKTGALRDSIGVTAGEGMKRTVGVGVDYAPAVELGTTTRAATPFLSPALEQVVPDIKRDGRKILD